jgi:hypothetical protein
MSSVTPIIPPERAGVHNPIPCPQGLCVLRDGDTEQGERGIGIPAIEA